MKRLFLDVSVLFTAAHNPNGKAALLNELGKSCLWRLASSAYAVEEARRNLARKYPDRLPDFELLSTALHLVPAAPDRPCPPPLAGKNCPIYQAALACKADVLLTGDLRDFGFLMNAPEKSSGLLIQTVSDFLSTV